MGGGAHNERLQSLRGLAALSVLIGHATLLVEAFYPGNLVLRIVQPNAAVILFYVLSGFVLGQSLRRANDDRSDPLFWRWTIRRVARLAPIYWLAVLLGAASLIAMAGPPIDGASTWFNGFRTASPAVTFDAIAQNLLAVATFLNQPLWSIQVEMWAILFLPAMVVVSLRTSLRTSLRIDVAILVALSIAAKCLMYSSFAAAYPALVFAAYLNCFYLGVMLPKLIAIPAVRALFSSGQFISALVIFQYWFTNYFAHTLGLDFAATLVIDALFAAALVGYALSSTANEGAPILAWRPLVGLGDISYSLYAFGLPITTVCAMLVLEHAPDGWHTSGLGAIAVVCAFTGVAFVVTSCVSWASYRLIELPGIALGRRLTAVSDRPSLPATLSAAGP